MPVAGGSQPIITNVSNIIETSFKIRAVEEGQDFVTANFNGKMIEKFVPFKTYKAATLSTDAIPNGQTQTFQFLNLDVKDVNGIILVFSSSQQIDDDQENPTIIVDYTAQYFAENDVPIGEDENTQAGSDFFHTINMISDNRQLKSSMKYNLNVPAAAQTADIAIDITNNYGSDIDVTIDVYLIY